MEELPKDFTVNVTIDKDSLPEEWVHPTPLPFIPPRIGIEYSVRQQYHTCGDCKYDGVPEKNAPCVNWL